VTITASAVLEVLGDGNWDEGEKIYIQFHLRRFVFLLNLIAELLDRLNARTEAPARYLDVGPHLMTRLADHFFGRRVRIDTLGWENPRTYDTGRVARHFEFDLNDAYDRDRWPEAVEHDLVLMAEVIEHLYTAPEQVLGFLLRYVRPGGYVIIGTPNAVSIQHRLAMVAGRHPYERIRLDRTNPGHFREYTRQELAEVARGAGFSVDRVSYSDYATSSRWAVLRAALMLVPSFRPYMTLVLKRSTTTKA
jgi:SAM-dependent methyltransferase